MCPDKAYTKKSNFLQPYNLRKKKTVFKRYDLKEFKRLTAPSSDHICKEGTFARVIKTTIIIFACLDAIYCMHTLTPYEEVSLPE